jgi:hypothetical protein
MPGLDYYQKCLTREAVARTIHATLNRMMVGRVFTVEDQIKATLDAMANKYNHQN